MFNILLKTFAKDLVCYLQLLKFLLSRGKYVFKQVKDILG